ncbi:hypothetical protein ABZ400_18730 [Streptomyces sp. NPDC005897]|uniref:hypothetical protein n=1 Tax=Streptomyces sp. NPDC005897 TaxID=3157081 RepID=UPI0033D74D56
MVTRAGKLLRSQRPRTAEEWAIGGTQSADPHQAAAVLDALRDAAPDHLDLP